MKVFTKTNLLVLFTAVVSLSLLGGSVYASAQSKPAIQAINGQATVVSLPKPTTVTTPIAATQSNQPVIRTSPNQPAKSSKEIKHAQAVSTESATLYGHIYYDASGNACGIGPTGICLMPVQKSFNVLDENNNYIQTVSSDNNGSFSVTLKPGTYHLEPEPGDGINPTAADQTVQLVANGSTEVTILYTAIATTNSLIVE